MFDSPVVSSTSLAAFDRYAHPGPRRFFGGLASGLTLCLTLGGCDRPPSADSLVEWTPSDHHSNDDNTSARAPAQRPESTAGSDDASQLVDIAWRQQCSSCHGSSGRGDGQLGPMVGAPDLTNAKWQDEVTDDQLAFIIKNGRNRMPKFDFPDPVVRGLVQRVRSLRQR